MQYNQNFASLSCDASPDISLQSCDGAPDVTLQLLQLHLASYVKFLATSGIKDPHMTFVDDLLLPREHILVTTVCGVELKLPGGLACLAALFCFS